MTLVVMTGPALADLARLTNTNMLPASTRARVKRSLKPLATFPLIGRSLDGGWDGYRYVLGPWSWMLIVYRLDPAVDRVLVVAIHDGRSARSATAGR